MYSTSKQLIDVGGKKAKTSVGVKKLSIEGENLQEMKISSWEMKTSSSDRGVKNVYNLRNQRSGARTRKVPGARP